MKRRASQSSSSGCDGRSPSDAEIVRAADDAPAEMPAPQAVHENAGGERVFAAGHPARQFETAALLRGQDRLRERGLHDLREAAIAILAEREVAAADVHGQGLCDRAVGHAHDGGRVGSLVLQRHQVRVHHVQLREPAGVERVRILVRDREKTRDIVERVERRIEPRIVELRRLGVGGLGSFQRGARFGKQRAVVRGDVVRAS